MQKAKGRNYEIDMCNGPIFSKIVLFAIPLMISGVLQLLFNAADIVVVGRFAGSESLAAVGSTSALVNLIVNMFMGLSVGANVLVAQFYGARKARELEETVHTAMLVAVIGGFILIAIGQLLAPPLLRIMGTPEDVLPLSVLYIRIFFLGMPVNLVYNFGSAILRAVGDTRRPLYYLFLAGVINVVLNLIFVIVFHMGVAGVALATIISQAVSAALVVRCLVNDDAAYRLNIRNLRIVPNKLSLIIRIGLPAGVQGSVFSVSNMLIQSSVNSFGSVVMAGNTAAQNIEGFIYTAMNSLYQAALSFTSQNFGARKFKRITKVQVYCVGLVAALGLILGTGLIVFAEKLVGIYSSDPEVIHYGVKRLSIISITYFICGMMDVMVGGLRGLGASVFPMIVSILGACGVRVLWVLTVFASHRSLEVLYSSYPVSWFITLTAHVVTYILVRRHMKKVFPEKNI